MLRVQIVIVIFKAQRGSAHAIPLAGTLPVVATMGPETSRIVGR
jgi:hypothetical protein